MFLYCGHISNLLTIPRLNDNAVMKIVGIAEMSCSCIIRTYSLCSHETIILIQPSTFLPLFPNRNITHSKVF